MYLMDIHLIKNLVHLTNILMIKDDWDLPLNLSKAYKVFNYIKIISK